VTCLLLVPSLEHGRPQKIYQKTAKLLRRHPTVNAFEAISHVTILTFKVTPCRTSATDSVTDWRQKLHSSRTGRTSTAKRLFCAF